MPTTKNQSPRKREALLRAQTDIGPRQHKRSPRPKKRTEKVPVHGFVQPQRAAYDGAHTLFFSCLIDTLGVAVSVRHRPLAKYAKNNANYKRQGTYVFNVRSPFSEKITARVMSRDSYRTLFIEGSVVKYMTGQNIVGREDLHEPAQEWILLVLKQMEITPTTREIANIRAGKYKVQRLDHALHCDCGSVENASAVMAAIRLLMFGRAANPSAYRYETVYANQHSPSWTLRAYRKDIEVNLRSRQMPANVYGRAFLLDKIVGCVRLELVLRSRELKRLGLTNPLSWSPTDARARMQVWIDRLSTMTGKVPAVADIDRLRSSVQLKLRAWLLGDHAAFTRSPSTAAACRRDVLRTTGIDIRGVPSVERQRQSVLALRKVFRRGIGFKSYAHKWSRMVQTMPQDALSPVKPKIKPR